MKLRAKPLAAGALAAAAAAWWFYPNPLWPTGWLLKAARGGNDLFRLIAVQELGSRAAKDPDRALPALLAALGDSWDEVGGAASAALCAAGPRAVPGLEAALAGGGAKARANAALALDCMKPEGRQPLEAEGRR